MTEEIINSDGTRNWEANILLDNIKRLEQENKQMKSALDTIQRMVLSAWEQGKYLDGGLYNDLTNEFAKINEVLQ